MYLSKAIEGLVAYVTNVIQGGNPANPRFNLLADIFHDPEFNFDLEFHRRILDKAQIGRYTNWVAVAWNRDVMRLATGYPRRQKYTLNYEINGEQRSEVMDSFFRSSQITLYYMSNSLLYLEGIEEALQFGLNQSFPFPATFPYAGDMTITALDVQPQGYGKFPKTELGSLCYFSQIFSIEFPIIDIPTDHPLITEIDFKLYKYPVMPAPPDENLLCQQTIIPPTP